jgi:hypothetical protein
MSTLGGVRGGKPRGIPLLDFKPPTEAPGRNKAWNAGLSLLHVPTGLFGYWGQAVIDEADAHQWMIQAGITKNWFGLGNTAIYGEYSRSIDWGAGIGSGRDYTSAAATAVGLIGIDNVTDTELTAGASASPRTSTRLQPSSTSATGTSARTLPVVSVASRYRLA